MWQNEGIINSDGKAVAYGQHGYGPGASFGFAIAADKYDQIKDGFTVEYHGLIRYEYVRCNSLSIGSGWLLSRIGPRDKTPMSETLE
ncbi:hypothetical protein DQX05_00610 [Paenibacillus thiaminolyticus]|uniref:Uncharacterized protein n=1 Tax=Paenibacillus thiaminolyticus TaxID=49283 RepID=A0A3A3H8L4_PANTH|nr:hypothetical protein DQX05_00610 [Paenibacillus thiaminolyticus]